MLNKLIARKDEIIDRLEELEGLENENADEIQTLMEELNDIQNTINTELF